MSWQVVPGLDLLNYLVMVKRSSDVLNVAEVGRGEAGVWVRVPVDFPLTFPTALCGVRVGWWNGGLGFETQIKRNVKIDYISDPVVKPEI
jgi:hypothetical protein